MKEFFDQLKLLFKRKSIASATVMLCLLTVICAFVNPLLFSAGFIITACYIALNFLIAKQGGNTKEISAQASSALGIPLDFVNNLHLPAIILAADGAIIWYNQAFVSASSLHSSIYGKNASEEINPAFTPSCISQLMSDVTFSLRFNERDYEVLGHKLTSGGKDFCVVLLDDKTELSEARKLLSDKNAIVAFILLDNLGEAGAFAQEKYRDASAKAAGIISDWAKGLSGLVKEYERDKYILVFEEKQLESILSSKFDILDTIREIEIEDVSVPITASVGISNIDGTFAEKERNARAALELALQRGGDQAVFKTSSSTEYYGGKTKTVQKKTKIRSRVIAGELVSLIRQSGNVIIMGHKFCDHDSIASCVAVSRIAEYLGKESKIVVNIHDSNLKPIFQKMRGHTYYHELFTDAASAQDLIRSDTLLIICDTNNPELFESHEIYEACINYCIIDHHRKIQEEYVIPPRLSYIEPSASSASELVTEIAEYAIPEGTLTKVEAELLFAGMVLDTDNFKKNTGTKTFSAALFLRSQGAEPGEAQEFFKTNFDDFRFEADIENNISIYRENIIIAASSTEPETPGQAKLVSSKSANRLLGISGISATFVLATVGNDVNISARSDGTINVQLILESLGGGGHFDAAGALIQNTPADDVLDMLKQAIDNFFDNPNKQ